MAPFLNTCGEGVDLFKNSTYWGGLLQGEGARPETSKGVMSERILVVDDEKLIRWSLRENLERAGYQTVEAADGEQAIKILDSDGADMVLLDVRMPGKDGLEVLRHIAEKHPETPAVLITAFSSVLEGGAA